MLSIDLNLSGHAEKIRHWSSTCKNNRLCT